MDQKILERIQKLMSLATSDNPHEASLALQKAQELMAAHSVDAIDLKLSDFIEVRVETPSSVSKMKPHELLLVTGIAQAFGCSVLWYAGHRFGGCGEYGVIGQKDSVRLAVYACTVMMRRMRRARSEFSIKLSRMGYLGREKTSELDVFCRGWARSATEKAAALAMTQEVKDLHDEFAKRSGARMDEKARMSAVKSGTSSAYRAGLESGSEEDLHRPMGEERTRRVGQTLRLR